jgi:sucrose phosphorylase
VTFFNFLASHDGVGINPARGILSEAEIDALVAGAREHGGFVSYKQNADGTVSPYELNINYFDALSNPDADEPISTQVNRFIAAQAIMLSLVGVPGIYFHSLFGSRGDRAGAAASGIPRRINRQKFKRSEMERALADAQSLRAQVFACYAELLRVRRAHRAFHPHGSQHILFCGNNVFAVMRVAPDLSERVLCLHNVTNSAATVRLSRNWKGEFWKDLVRGREYRADHEDAITFELQPYQVVWAQQMSGTETLVSQVTRSKEQAERGYDRISRWYDWSAGSESKYVRAGLEMLAAKEGKTILEIG